ncbi:efflux ABC transporter, permease protein [Streptococcus ictaluri 707-05]|uniref:Putative hemin transport system permease protein HrtB n=1 Tax=Streptococcus ictaluri 707-05 TaxID=764299 RepID=G5K3Y3_9STRE|nr:efflux ABC transporter, permease protein [Streptococcus ictaluri 707-05]
MLRETKEGKYVFSYQRNETSQTEVWLNLRLTLFNSLFNVFLTALAFGLVQENRSAIDKWQADTVFLTKDADANLNLSQLVLKQKDQIEADQVTALGQLNGVAWTVSNPKEKDKEKLSLFGIEEDSFLEPKVIEGEQLSSDNEVIIDKSAALKGGFNIGDDLSLSTTDKTFKIVGYTEGDRFSVAPVAYLRLKAFQEAKFGQAAQKQDNQVNAFVVKGKVSDYPKESLQKLSIESFITKLPGYNAQVLTFAFMIGFLVLISAIIIGIFMYVLTIQKAPIFGIMKAQGIANKTIANAVLAQTFILTTVGSALGLLGTWLTSLVLPVAVPFQSNWYLYSIILVSMITFALLGTLFSVLAIVKIDPLKAIG